jgi:putative effector of murein hydrolase LrgA (UPF0299 family)
MLSGFIQILLFQGLGEIISKIFLPSLPGPVIGLVLLLFWLMLRSQVNSDLEMVANALTHYLGLLFVPAAVGVVLFLPQLRDNATAIIVTLFVSSALTIAGSACVLRLLSKRPSSD